MLSLLLALMLWQAPVVSAPPAVHTPAPIVLTITTSQGARVVLEINAAGQVQMGDSLPPLDNDVPNFPDPAFVPAPTHAASIVPDPFPPGAAFQPPSDEQQLDMLDAMQSDLTAQLNRLQQTLAKMKKDRAALVKKLTQKAQKQ